MSVNPADRILSPSAVTAPPDESAQSAPVTTKVVIISSVMFVFISYWRVAAVVLCDLASTAFYIGGIVEHSIGPAAPWFIVGVMVFSYAVRSVYIESCSMFVRGGVYRIVKESLGRTTAKIAVSALLFDYVLTGPISGVSAGQYLMSLWFELWTHFSGIEISHESRDYWKAVGSVVIACAITIYFFRLNVVGIHESSDKALRIMVITTVMGVTIVGWSLLTLAIEGPQNSLTFQPTFTPKMNPSTNQPESPLGFLEGTKFAESLMDGWHWLSFIGFLGFFIAFGHSVLAMSGEETLAQIYREVEAPKLKNFKRAAFIVFIYSLLLTGGISVLAVLLIPDDVRMVKYGDNLIAGLAMSVYGTAPARLLLNAFVVSVGALILAGAVNTAIIGSNGVLNRVAEDGVIPDWFLKPHPRFGTTYRLLFVILGLQLFTIFVSRGDVLLLGEAYAFGVVWSFVFNCLAMLVLRFKDPDRPRGFKVPFNVKIAGTEIPVGLGLIFIVLLISAITNVMTKEIATEAGLCFTAVLFALFAATEHFRRKETGPGEKEYLDEFNEVVTDSVTPQTLNLKHQHRKVVAIRSQSHLEPVDKVLEETDAETTDIIVMTAKLRPIGGVPSESAPIDIYERELMNAIEKRAETAGKPIIPIIVSTNNTLHAVLQTVQAVGAQELLISTSERLTVNEQLDRCAFHWSQLHSGRPAPLTVRIIGQNRDFTLDIEGGSHTPSPLTNEETAGDQEMEPRKRLTDVSAPSPAAVADGSLILYDGIDQSSDLLHKLAPLIAQDAPVCLLRCGSIKSDQFDLEIQQLRNSGQKLIVEKLEVTADLAEAIIQSIRTKNAALLIVAVSPSSSLQKDGNSFGWLEKVLTETDCQILFLPVRR